jgi:hypothetical protein
MCSLSIIQTKQTIHFSPCFLSKYVERGDHFYNLLSHILISVELKELVCVALFTPSEESINQLVAMGFDHEAATKALIINVFFISFVTILHLQE